MQSNTTKDTNKNGEHIITALYDKHAPEVYRYVYLRIGIKEVAEDIMQDTFIRFIDAYAKREKQQFNTDDSSDGEQDLSHIQNVKAYIFKIARNLISDFLRSGSFQQHQIEISEVENLLPDEIGQQRTEAQVELNKVAQSLSILGDDLQEVITLRCVHDMSYEEIASVTGKSQASLRISVHRVLTKLRKELRRDDQ